MKLLCRANLKQDSRELSLSSIDLPSHRDMSKEELLALLIEREQTFASNRKEFKRILKELGIKITNFKCEKVDQHYFQNQDANRIGKILAKTLGCAKTLTPNDFSQARIRTVKSKGLVRFYLQAKGKLSWFRPSEKIEFSLQITEERFKKLQKLAHKGSLFKNRIIYKDKKGNNPHIFDKDGNKHEVFVEFYEVVAAGKGSKRTEPNCGKSLIFIDLEFSSRFAEDSFKKGRFDNQLAFLRNATNVRDIQSSTSSAIGMTKLARHNSPKKILDRVADYVSQLRQKKAA